MRTTLITPNKLDPEIVRFAAEWNIPTFKAMNELMKLGLAFYRLFGPFEQHKHAWKLEADGKIVYCIVCGEAKRMS